MSRLRPVVYASATPNGLHIRGWSASFTIDGGAGLWRLWQALEGRLVEGITAGEPPLPGVPERLSGAVSLIIEQLRAHDMLVEVPAGWARATGTDLPEPDLASWLESVAADPLAAWRRLRETSVRVSGAGPVARAATRALVGAGMTTVAASPSVPGRLCLTAGGSTVVAECGAEAGFVLPVGRVEDSTVAAVADRLGLARGGNGVPPALGALVGGAAAHRLICRVAELPDPAVEAAILTVDGPAPPTRPERSVLVARLDPLRASYHPWLPISSAAPDGDDPLRVYQLLEALTDPELGLLPAPEHGALPQLPAMLATAGDHLGVATTADAARLDAALRAAGQRLTEAYGMPVVVGTDLRHATGVVLRRLADSRVRSLPTTPIAERDWAGSPVARQWWKALTLRFGVPAGLRVRRLGLAAHAEITVDGDRLAWAVESDPADAVAFAALAATGLVQARAAGVKVDAPLTVAGAAPAPRPDHGPEVTWTDDSWLWPAAVGANEERLQADLRETLAGIAPIALRPLPSPSGGVNPPEALLLRALAAVSFVAVAGAGGQP